MKNTKVIGASIALGLLAFTLPLWMGSRSVYGLDVRSRPWHLLGGRLSASNPLGQAFVFEGEGLSRVEVALSAVGGGPEGDVLFELREGDSEGPLLRTTSARLDGLSYDPGTFVAFDFKPLTRAESGSGEFHLRLMPLADRRELSASPWLRSEQMVGLAQSVAGEFEGRECRGRFFSRFGELAGLAVAVKRVPADSRPTLILRAIDSETGLPRAGAALRTSEALQASELRAGHLIFDFESIENSRYRDYALSLNLPEGAELSSPQNSIWIPLHGDIGEQDSKGEGLSGSEGLRGFYRGNQVQPKLNWIMRAKGKVDGRAALVQFAGEHSLSVVSAILLWLGAVIGVLVALATGRTASNPD